MTVQKTYKKGARSQEPIESITVGEEETICNHCGSRTYIVDEHLDGSRREDCLHCGQMYFVEDEIEVVDEFDNFDEKEEYDRRPTIGELLKERLKQSLVKQVEEETAYGTSFGSF